jgi:adenine-specific DNA-methyltransferase
MRQTDAMAGKAKKIADYRHEAASRLNNPTAALAREDVAPVPKRRFEFDPHVAPELVWAGKAEEPGMEVDAPSIHVHERLSTDAILKAAQHENAQVALFADPELERAKQVEFYEHEMGWTNRLILGDSLVVMTSLLSALWKRKLVHRPKPGHVVLTERGLKESVSLAEEHVE